MKLYFSLTLLFLSSICGFASETDTSASPKDGVYFSYTGYMTTVLELKNGHFRYWFESDLKMLPEPTYPLTGIFLVNGDTITLEHDEIYKPVRTWTFRMFDGALTLWRPDAFKTKNIETELRRFSKYGLGSILIFTSKPAEDVWTHRGAPSL